MDPLASKYPGLSPYVYCVGNPIKYVDPDGKKIVVAKGSSSNFKDAVNIAIRLLYENKAHEIVQQLINADFIITIVETNAENGSYRTNNTITWNPYVGFIMENGTIISPTTVLNHEFDHA